MKMNGKQFIVTLVGGLGVVFLSTRLGLNVAKLLCVDPGLSVIVTVLITLTLYFLLVGKALKDD